MPGLCFLIQGNMAGAAVTFGQPIRPTKVPIYQKPQNCRFVHTEESGQKRRGRIEKGRTHRSPSNREPFQIQLSIRAIYG